MPASKQRQTTFLQYEAIRKDYLKFLDVKENGIQKYTQEWILMKLGEKYFKSPRTIENIVFHRTGTEKPGMVQLDMFT
jgi:hypothetical protein